MKKFFFIAALFLSVSATAQPPCKGTTKAGQPCKSIIVNKESGYCNAHNPNRAKCERAYLIGTHSISFRRGVPAEILTVVFFKHEDNAPRLCYHVRFKDGKEDYTPVCDADNYKVITKEEAEELLKKL